MESVKQRLDNKEVGLTNQSDDEQFVPSPENPYPYGCNTLKHLIPASPNRIFTLAEQRHNERVMNEYAYAQERMARAREREAQQAYMQMPDIVPPSSQPDKVSKSKKPSSVDTKSKKEV